MNFFRHIMEGGEEWVRLLVEQLSNIPTATTEEEGFPYPPLPIKWRNQTEWTHKKAAFAAAAGTYSPIYNEYNIPLRYGTLGIAEEKRLFLFEDERAIDEWTRPAARVLTEAWPLVLELMWQEGAEHLGNVIITRLPPGGVIDPHVDRDKPIPGLPYWERYQIMLSGESTLRCGDEEIIQKPGDVHWFDGVRSTHSVHNYSDKEDRIAIVVLLRRLFR